MKRSLCLATTLVVLAAAAAPASAKDHFTRKDHRFARLDANGNLDALIARHAAANNVPEALVRRVIMRESGGNPRAISKGNYGIMQIRLGTARALGYRGSAAGLLDADTNMTYAVKYLAGAYHVAGGNPARAVHYYAAGYYYAAKRKGLSAMADANPADRFQAAFDGNGTFASRASLSKAAARQSAARLREARSERMKVSSSSRLYGGSIDYH